MKKIPTVVLLGRVNVGKSTLFNKLCGARKALESPVAGTTRDYNQTIINWRDKTFRLLDTGGFTPEKPNEEITKETLKYALAKAEEADLIILVADFKEGLVPADKEIFTKLKKYKSTVVVAVNKVDKARDRDNGIAEFSSLGAEHLATISAVNGQGTGDLLDIITALIPKIDASKLSTTENDNLKTPTIRLTIVGQPNVGKSSILNALTKKERAIVSSIPHTTRDSHDEIISHNGEIIEIVDTAGIRRQKKKGDLIEKFSTDVSLQNLRRSNIALLVFDISQKISYQDKKLADKLIETGNSIIIVANKWDLIIEKETNTIKEYQDYIYAQLPHLSWAPIIFVSALNGQRINKILDKSLEIWQERFRKIDDNALDKFIKKIIKIHKPARDKGVAHPYIYRLRQTGVNPPRFELTIKYQKSLHQSYIHFIQNKLREKFGFLGTPIKIYVKALK